VEGRGQEVVCGLFISTWGAQLMRVGLRVVWGRSVVVHTGLRLARSDRG
jgi:hypothetical protein